MSDRGAVAPLDDVRVVEIDNWMAAPSAGAILSDLGADVVKVEPLRGDPMRTMGRPVKTAGSLKGFDATFDVDNRGKRSIAVDLEAPDGQALVRLLCERAQVFLCNLLAPRQARFGLDPATLLTHNPRLVHATLTGYGTSGPESWRPGYDVTAFFGRSGLYDALREGDDGIVPMARPAQGDHTTGLALVGAILAALRLAERSGVGQVVETSLYETAVWTQASDYAVTAIDGAPVRRRTRKQLIAPLGNRYPCGDGKWVVLNMPEDHWWPRFCPVVDRPEWVDDPRFATTKGRFDHMAELVELIDEALSARSRDEWAGRFDAAGLIWGPALSLDEVVRDGQAEALGLFPTIEHPDRGAYRSVSIPMRFHTAPVGPKGPAPAVGAHTRAVLADAGLAASDIDDLVARGVVRG